MFPVYVDNGKLDVNNLDNICHIITKEGIFLRKKVGIVDALIRVNSIPSLTNSKLKKYGSIDIPKINKEDFAKVAKFFSWAYSEHNGEACVLIYFNQNTNEFKIFPTTQEVSGASVNYERNGLSHTGFTLIGSIHSHANFGASHSNIDDKDEEKVDGVHITIGNVTDTYPSISCSVVINGNRFMYDPEEYIDGIIKVKTNSEDNQNPNKVISYISKDRFFIQGFEDSIFDNDWKDKIQKRVYATVTSKPNCRGKHGTYQQDNSLYKDSVGDWMNMASQGFDDSYSFFKNADPCDTCIFRDFKSQKILEELQNFITEDEESFTFIDEEFDEDSEPGTFLHIKDNNG